MQCTVQQWTEVCEWFWSKERVYQNPACMLYPTPCSTNLLLERVRAHLEEQNAALAAEHKAALRVARAASAGW